MHTAETVDDIARSAYNRENSAKLLPTPSLHFSFYKDLVARRAGKNQWPFVGTSHVERVCTVDLQSRFAHQNLTSQGTSGTCNLST